MLGPGPPRYRLRRRKPQPVRETIHSLVDAWLAADREAPRKQRHTAKRVYTRLVEEHGYVGSERTVRLYVQEWKRAHQSEATGFLPLAYAPRAKAQGGWGDAVVRIGGVEQAASDFCICLAYSFKPFVCAFPAARQECFFASHEAAFVF